MRVWLMRLAATLLAVSVLGAGAAEADIFTVTDIPVEATADSAVAARTTALEQGQRDGLGRLVRRLTSPLDHGRLPSRASADLDRLVVSYEIASESVGPTQYLGTLNVTYAPDQVGELLRDTGLAFVDRRTEPVLLIPALVTETGYDLWSEDNPWRAAWNRGEPVTFLDLRLPLGDLADVAGLQPPALADGDVAALERFAVRYGTEREVVAFLRPQTPEGADPALQPTTPAPVELELRRADEWARPFGATTLTPAPDETEEQLLDRAVEAALLAAEDDWKRQNLVSEDRLARLDVVVPLADLAGWVQIRSRLAAITGVQSLRVLSFARTQAIVQVLYAGGFAELEDGVARAGMQLVQESGGWRLRQAGGLGALSAPSRASLATR